VGDSWSLAWRVLDAQYWGVPQRRKRIFLVADFTGRSAGEILFKPEGLPGNIAAGEKAGEGIAGNAGNCAKAAGFHGWRSITGTIEYAEDRAPCMQATKPPDIVVGVDGHNQNLTGDKVNTLRGGRVDKDNIGLVILNDQGGSIINIEKGDVSPTLRSQAKGHEPLVFEPGAVSRTGNHYYEDGKTGALRANMGDNQFALVYDARGMGDGETVPTMIGDQLSSYGAIALTRVYDARGNGDGKTAPTMVGDHNGRLSDYSTIALDCRNLTPNDELSAPLQAKPNGGQSLNYINPIAAFRYKSFGEYEQDNKAKALLKSDDITTGDLITSNYYVRRLTPLECERLQGLPDQWTEYGHDGKKISDSARYKALGNGMAKPCVDFIIQRVKETACHGASDD